MSKHPGAMVWALAEKLHSIWWLRWAGDSQAWPLMGDAYRKVWFDIALAALDE